MTGKKGLGTILNMAVASPPRRPFWRRFLPLWGVLLLLVTTPFPEYQLDLRTDESFTATYTRHQTPAMVLEEVRKSRRIFQPEPFILPYRLTGPWKRGELALFRYEISSGEKI